MMLLHWYCSSIRLYQVISTSTNFFPLFLKVFNGMSLADLQVFIMEQENMAVRAEAERDDSQGLRDFQCSEVDTTTGQHSRDAGTGWGMG